MNSRQIQSTDVTGALGFTPLSTINGLDSSTTNVSVAGKPTMTLAAALAALNTAIAGGASAQQVSDLAQTVSTLSGRVDANAQAIAALPGPLTVSDGTHTIAAVTKINVSGATVAQSASGVAQLTIVASGGGGGGGGGSGTLYSHHALSDYFQLNFPTPASTLIDNGAAGPIVFKTTGHGTNDVCGADLPLPATSNWTVRMRLRATRPMVDYLYSGIYLRDEVSGYMKLFGFGAAVCNLALQNFTAYDTYESQDWLFPLQMGAGAWDFRIDDDGTNLNYFISNDGMDIVVITNGVKSANPAKSWAHIVSTPRTKGAIATRVGFGFNVADRSYTYSEYLIGCEQDFISTI